MATGGGEQSASQPLAASVTDLALHSEDEVQRRLAELAQLPEKNPGPVLWIDQDATVLLANAAARRAFGDDIVGACWRERCPGMTDELWARARASDEPFVVDAQLEEACVAFSYVSSDGGDFVFAFGTDISDRRRAEQQLAEVARFPEMNPGPVLRLDESATVLLANHAAREVFGEQVVGSCWFDLYPAARDLWDEIRAADAPIPLDARIGECDYLFTHRSDTQTNLVFVFGADVTQHKLTERALHQSERMATLGTLAAGVAHELNNPAAATRRAADQLREAFGHLQDAQLGLLHDHVEDRVQERLRDLDVAARAASAKPAHLDAIERSDREGDVEDWLDDHDLGEDWDMAPSLVAQGLDTAALDALVEELGEEGAGAIVRWAAAAFPVYQLAHEIDQGSGRISEIVGALKGYSYLGQAPRQEIDLHEGIDNTLVILRNKMKVGVEVRRSYGDDVPRVPAYGSELNQVWTNLLDNAVDAMGGHGMIDISTRLDGSDVVVEITDDGPGIAAGDVAHIFDPFFTTKEPGKGTGLGLATTYGIVTEKHGGSISVASEPGRTRFTVRLPRSTEEGA